MRKSSDRTLQLKVLVSRVEKRALTKLADAKGVTMSDIVRGFIRKVAKL
jgi:hypothetical protein